MTVRWSDQHVERLEKGNSLTKNLAASTLRNLATSNPKHRMSIVMGGGVPHLVNLAREGEKATREHAAAVLKILAFNNTDIQQVLLNKGCLQLFLELAQSDNPALQEQGAGGFMHLAAVNPATRFKVFETGAMPVLIDLLRSNEANPNSLKLPEEAAKKLVREQAAGALRMLVLQNEEGEDALVKGGGIPFLVTLLNTENPVEQEHAAHCLKNMVSNNNPITERTIMASNAAPRLIELLKNADPEVQGPVADTLMCLVDRMVESVVSDEPGRPEKGAEAIAYLAAVSSKNRKAIIDEGAVPPVVTLLLLERPKEEEPDDADLDEVESKTDSDYDSQAEESEVAPEFPALSDLGRQWACRALRNLVTDEDYQCSDDRFRDNAFQVVEQGAIPRLVVLLSHPVEPVQVEACCSLRALLTFGNSYYEKLIFECKPLPVLQALLHYEVPAEVQEASAALIGAMALTRDETRKTIGRTDILQGLINLLETPALGTFCAACEALKSLALNLPNSDKIQALNTFEICRKRMVEMETEEEIRVGCKALLKHFTGDER